jgi:hypothetical protein
VFLIGLLSELSVFIWYFPWHSCYRSYQYLSDIFPGIPVIGAISIYLIFSLVFINTDSSDNRKARKNIR